MESRSLWPPRAEKFGRIDICVANAGGPPPKNFLSISMDEWRKAVELSFLSVVAFARGVIPHMQRNHWGRFIAITSSSVRQPIPDLILSSAVRPAVVGLGEKPRRGVRQRRHHGQQCRAWVHRDRAAERTGERARSGRWHQRGADYEKWAADIPIRRLAKPEEIAETILWLASNRAAAITGQTIMVDGGAYRGM